MHTRTEEAWVHFCCLLISRDCRSEEGKCLRRLSEKEGCEALAIVSQDSTQSVILIKGIYLKMQIGFELLKLLLNDKERVSSSLM